VGEAGLLEQSSAEAKSLESKGQGTVATPVGNNRGSQTGGQRPKLKNYSHNNLLKETELKAALTGSTGRAKRQPAKDKQLLKKGKTLTLCSNLEIAEGEDVEVDEGVDG
jgi:hypothetical protein